MNSWIRLVFNVYALLVLLALTYVPWTGQRIVGGVDRFGPLYALLWDPPRVTGWVFALDRGRLLLEVVSLTGVLAVAVAALWGRDDSGGHQGNSRPS
jgi:hypothetical protein